MALLVFALGLAAVWIGTVMFRKGPTIDHAAAGFLVGFVGLDLILCAILVAVVQGALSWAS